MRFQDISAPRPVLDTLRPQYDALIARIEAAPNGDALVGLLETWESLRRTVDTYQALTHLRYAQDVNDADAKAAQDAMDEAGPAIETMNADVMRALVKSPFRTDVEAAYGATAFSLWDCRIKSNDPKIEDDLVAEAKAANRYMALTAKGQVELDGETMNLSALAGKQEHADRDVRAAAAAAYWGWFDDNSDEIDAIYDELTQTRHRMATALGYDSFTDLGYQRMARMDYNQDDVAQFRKEVREVLVPLCVKLREQQADALGIDQVMLWDENVFLPEGAAAPQGDEAWMMERAQEMFADLDPALDGFFRKMVAGGFLDLPARDGKAGGGFCTSFSTVGMPFVFANFNGTSDDVRVFTHEIGHAFQCYMSREQPLTDYLWPTYESCEIHSMSLEFLSYPSMERFFGDQADAFRRDHLMRALLFIPYGVAIDHFQHRIYAEPNATPAERNAMWKEMEEMYLPWRSYGDLKRPNEGAFWQRQAHVFGMPFYYIDYTLAQTCALQFWDRSLQDRDEAMEAYVALCKRGGEATFQDLARSAGLRSPFEPGCLHAVVQRAADALF